MKKRPKRLFRNRPHPDGEAPRVEAPDHRREFRTAMIREHVEELAKEDGRASSVNGPMPASRAAASRFSSS